MKFTVGPWKSTPEIRGIYIIYSEIAPYEYIAKVGSYTGKTDIPQTECNANLIAAAPDLLEACKSIQQSIYYSRLSTAKQDLLTDAINKAEGKS
mgnify:CR=1 FL=1